MELLDQSESKLASYRKYRLANGLTVIVVQRQQTRSFNLCMKLNVGMRDGNPHVAHLVEHLLAERMSQFCERSEYSNACTCFDSTRYLMSAHVDEFDSGLEAMKSVLLPMTANEKQVKHEVAVLCRELSEAGLCQLVIDQERTRILGGDKLATRYRKAVKGMRLSIRTDEANAFIETHYQPCNATLVISSPLNTDALVEKIAEVFGDVESSAAPAGKTKNTELAETKKRLHSSWHAGMANVSVWHKMSGSDFFDHVSLTFLNGILGESGRLFEELRTKNSLCYGVYSDVGFFDDTCWHCAFVNIAPWKIRRAASLLNQVVEGIVDPMLEKEFENRRLTYVQRCEILEDDHWSLITGLLRGNGVGSRLMTPQVVKNAVLELTPQSVATFARRFFATENQHWLLSGRFDPIGFYTVKRLSSR